MMQRKNKSFPKSKTTEVKYLIIGGGVAGTTAAETIRERDATGSITIVSDEPYRLYSRIMLSKPNFFLGKIPFEQIWLKSESWYTDKRITFMPGTRAQTLDAENQQVTLSNGMVFRYEKLLLAVGVLPNAWQVPGSDRRGVNQLRTLDDAKVIIQGIKRVKHAVCIGSGFTTFEMCDMLRMAGVDVTVVMREPHYWDPLLDSVSGGLIEQAMVKGGVKIVRQALVKTVDGGRSVTGVTLESGEKIPCSMVIAGVGTYVPCDWVKTGGVAVNRGILANEYLETNFSNIWTAGDCAEFNDLILEEQLVLGNWANSRQQGALAGGNMVGGRTAFKMVSFYTANGFDITIAFVGDVRAKDRQVIVRGSSAQGFYIRLIVDDHDEIAGATFINKTPEMAPVSKLIETNVKVSPIRPQLEDPAFDLHKLVS
ncbi:MAG: FAD-dependent oxidoreductase [Patescibacteria group bacterium]|nr:FAD-dependent oxidoreductase [Patescibacteria group bacterium]